MKESLILVDQFGRRTGVAERQECHRGAGLRHRAFVTFLQSRQGELLLQKRAANKLGGSRWDVSATSHVRADEDYASAIKRCLRFELGVEADLSPRYQLAYVYQDKIGQHAENEYCSLFLLDFDGPIEANRLEMDETRWISPVKLRTWFEKAPDQFTSWFSQAFSRMNFRH